MSRTQLIMAQGHKPTPAGNRMPLSFCLGVKLRLRLINAHHG